MRTVPVAYILWLFLGLLGAHRFYCNRVGTGILWALTAGLGMIGWLVDLFLVPGMVRRANADTRLRDGLSRVPAGGLPRCATLETNDPRARQGRLRVALAPGHRVLYCTHCGAPMQIPVPDIGKHFACPTCHYVVIAPG
ncbi:MAG: NINE protein [Phycisphaerales bacterium]|nr:MAG: NINE protein [Phycisphaerales bacterium]